MLKKRVEEALNAQINAEIWSAYYFLSMSMQFAAEGYEGFSHWMKIQYQEEQAHAFKLIHYINEQGGRVFIGDIIDIPHEFGSPLETFEQALVHEMRLTESIDALSDAAKNENDKATRAILDWFILKQIEQEAIISRIIVTLKRNSNGNGLYIIDRELGNRTIKKH